MNVQDLVSELTKCGVRRSSYTLDSRDPNEQYVLHAEDGGWVVYYSERGIRRKPTRFSTEDEACRFLLKWICDDPTTRK
jgi:hypothetical protein